MKKLLSLLLALTLLVPSVASSYDYFGGYDEGKLRGSNISLVTTNFGTNLSSADSDLQTAMDTIDDLVLGGGGDAVTVNGTAADTTANFADSIYTEWGLTDGGAGGPDDVTAKPDYDQTLAGNPALEVDECIPFKDTSGGGFLCEGSTADSNEFLVRFQDVNPADTTNYFAMGASDGDALAGDSATSFFDAGTLEHERGGLEADVSAYNGLIGITGGATYNQTGTSTQIVIFDGAGAPTSAALSGDATMTNAGVVTIVDDSHSHVIANIDSMTSAALAGQVSDETGSGALVFGTSPTLVTPALGTPASGVMTNVTGIPVGALANGTDGELITWSASAAPTTVAAGTSGQVLTSNGAGAAPTFQAAAGGGGFTFIAQNTPSGASTSNFTSLGSYNSILMVLSTMDVSTDGAIFQFRVSTDGGSTWKQGATDYKDLAGDDDQIAHGDTGVGNAAGEAFTGMYHWSKLADTGSWTMVHGTYAVATTAGAITSRDWGGAYAATTAVDGLQVMISAGTFSGTITLYGMNDS